MNSRYYLAYPRKLMSCVSVLGAFHVNTASTASGSGLTPCLSTILPRYLIESLRISHFDGLHFKPTLFMHPRTSSSRSMWSSRVGVANTSQDYRTFLSLWSKPEPSVFEKWPLRCTSRRASSSNGTTPTHTRIRSFRYPSSAEGPARRQNPSLMW